MDQIFSPCLANSGLIDFSGPFAYGDKMSNFSRHTIELETPNHYDLFLTCFAHGWVNLAPFYWDQRAKTLHFCAWAPDDIPVDIEATQKGAGIFATVTSHSRLTGHQVDAARDIVIRTLDLDTSTTKLLELAEKFGRDYVDIIQKGAGRLLHSPSLWEDAAKTLFTTNCTWSLTQKMCEAACSIQFSRATPSGAYPFPSAKTITAYTPAQIKTLMPVGYRSKYLVPLAQELDKDPTLANIETGKLPYKEADKLVRALLGFGDYAVAHLLILAGFFDEIPVDTVEVSYLKKNHRVRKPQSFIQRTYRKWKPYTWWGLKLEKMIRHQNRTGD